MKLIDKQLLDDVSRQAQKSDRLRMNYNFHQSLDDKCHRFLNAVEPGTKVEIHRHPTKDESFVLLRGRVRVNTYNDDGTVLMKDFGTKLTKAEVYRMLFGTELEPEKFGERPMSKLKRDLLEYLHIIEKG